MNVWEDITIAQIQNTIIRNYPNLKTKINEGNLLVDFNKHTQLDIHIGEIDELFGKWTSKVLVHLNLMQNKPQIKGQGLAVDNYKELDEQLQAMIKTGLEWAEVPMVKDTRKKLV